MTLEEYKSQVKEIAEASQNFKGTQEEAIKLFEDLAKKYPQVNEFNTKAMDCKDLTEFKNLADAFGMKFSSDDSAEKLFSMLQDGKKQLEAIVLKLQNGAELSDDVLEGVSAGKWGKAKWKKLGKCVGIGLAVGTLCALGGAIGGGFIAAVAGSTAAGAGFAGAGATVFGIGGFIKGASLVD